MKENYFLDDGAYVIAKLLITLAKLHIENKTIETLISLLPEPFQSTEIRYKITEPDFKTYGKKFLDELIPYIETVKGWEVVPNNYEGVRISCTENHGNGWFLLRLSLHDPVIPLNVESNSEGGVDLILQQLQQFISRYEKLER